MLNVEHGPTAIAPAFMPSKRSFNPSRRRPGVHDVEKIPLPQERADREAAPDDLAEADDVRIDPRSGDGPARPLHPEPRHDLVVDEGQVQVPRRLAERLEELRVARDEPPLDRLDDHRGEILAVDLQEL